MRIPPPYIRRLVTVPVVFGLTVAVFTGVPLIVLILALASPLVPGRWRPLRLFAFLLVYLVAECIALLVALDLWVASGFGWKLRTERFQQAHYLLLTWMLIVLYRAAVWLFKLRIKVEDPPKESWHDGPGAPRQPLLVMSRHAGPGDSFLLMYALLAIYNRRPRVVLKETLALDPAIDILLGRVPSCFVRARAAGGPSMADEIGRLAATMGPRDALVIFPEGGNFTVQRRRRAIERLRRRGMHDRAQQAEQLRHVLPPYTAGVLAAMEGAPDADAVLVAHAGLDSLSSALDLWRGLPMDQSMQVRWWRIRAEDLPTTPDERASWIYGWWFEVDKWIQAHHDRHGTAPSWAEELAKG